MQTISKHRLELFSDAVFAIIITVMLLEMHVPQGPGWRGWVPLLPSIAAYVVTFLFLLVVWAAHHHMFSHFREFDRRMYWANGLALLLISLFPLTVHNFTERPNDPAALVLYFLLATGAFNALTLIRLAANRTHKDEAGWAQWSKLRNRISISGNIAVLGIIALCYVSIPVALVLWLLLLIAVLIPNI